MRRVLALVGLAALAVPCWPGTSGADVVVTSGWWSRSPVPVPTDGLRLGSDAAGVSAVAAVRISPNAGEVPTELRLRLTSETNPQQAAVTACPAKGSWSPAAGGAWDTRPEGDCASGALAGARSGSDVVFDLNAVRPADGVVDLVLFIPGAALADLVVAKPDAASVTSTPGPATDTGSAPSSEVALPEPAPSFDTAPLPAPADPGPLTLAPPAAPALPEPQAAPQREAGRAPVAATPFTPVRRAVESVDDVRDRFLAGLVFLDLAVVWWLLNRRRAADTDPGRPRLSLHDDPATVLALAATPKRARREAPTLR